MHIKYATDTSVDGKNRTNLNNHISSIYLLYTFLYVQYIYSYNMQTGIAYATNEHNAYSYTKYTRKTYNYYIYS